MTLSVTKFLVLLLVIVSAILVWYLFVKNKLFDFTLSTENSFAGIGKISMYNSASGLQPVDYDRDSLNWDAVRLNKMPGNFWALNFDDLPVVRASDDSAAAMYLSLRFPQSFEHGTIATDGGLKVTTEVWQPSRVDANTVRIGDYQLTGQLHIEQLEPYKGGKLTGSFSLTDSQSRITGIFDLVLQEPPPLINLK